MKAHTSLYHSTLGLRVIKKMKNKRVFFSLQDALSADGNANLPCLAMALMMMAWCAAHPRCI